MEENKLTGSEVRIVKDILLKIDNELAWFFKRNAFLCQDDQGGLKLSAKMGSGLSKSTLHELDQEILKRRSKERGLVTYEEYAKQVEQEELRLRESKLTREQSQRRIRNKEGRHGKGIKMKAWRGRETQRDTNASHLGYKLSVTELLNTLTELCES